MKTRVRRVTGVSTKTAQTKRRHTSVCPKGKVSQVKQGTLKESADRSRGTELGKDGQLRSPVAGLFPGTGWLDRHHLHHRLAPVEAVVVCRRCHHHGCGSVRGAVDELRLTEYRTGAVQDL